MHSLPITDRLGRVSRRLAVVFLAGGILLRILYLDADPDYYAWTGYVTDEGRWIAHARALALSQNVLSIGWRGHLLLAPLFQAVSYVTFVFFGVSLLTSRLLAALSGSALLVIFWAVLRSMVSPEALLLALGMLAVEIDLVVLSRLAVPEMAAMVFELAAFILVVTQRAGRWGLFLGGLLMTAAIGMKATALPVAGILAVILLFHPARSPSELSRRATLTYFAAGLALPSLIAAVGLLVFCYRHVASLGGALRQVGSFVGLATPYMILSFPFDDDVAAVLAIWGLGVWLALLGWFAIPVVQSDAPRTCRLFTSAAIWTILYGTVMQLVEYFPGRYKVHILIPMSVVLAIGLSRVQSGGLPAVAAWFAGRRGGRRAAALVLLAIPTAVLVAPLLAAAPAVIVGDPSRLRIKVTSLLIALLFTVLLLHHMLRRGRQLSYFLLFPVAGTFTWLIEQRLVTTPPFFWPTPESAGQAFWWLLLLAAAAAATGVLLLLGRRAGPRAGAAGIVVAAVGYVVLGFIHVAPTYVHPHFSMRESSRDLGVLLAGSTRDIATSSAEGLFNDNALPYHSVFGHRFPMIRPEVIVIAFQFDDPQRLLEHEYRQIRSYEIYVSPEYARTEDRWLPLSEAGHVAVRVYRRIAAGVEGRPEKAPDGAPQNGDDLGANGAKDHPQRLQKRSTTLSAQSSETRRRPH